MVAGLMAWSGTASPISAQKSGFDARQVQAVFLFNFAQFVAWPPDAFATPQSPLVIGILGDDPFGAVLDDIVRGEAVTNRPLVVERYRRIDDIDACHILFVNVASKDEYEQLFASLQGRAILTVGDTDGFAAHGMIRFLTEQNRIRLRVNVSTVQAAGLTISSNLLRAADVVGSVGTP